MDSMQELTNTIYKLAVALDEEHERARTLARENADLRAELGQARAALTQAGELLIEATKRERGEGPRL